MYTYTLFQYIQLHSITCSAKPRFIQIAGNLVAPSVDRLDLLVLKNTATILQLSAPGLRLKETKDWTYQPFVSAIPPSSPVSR